MSQPPLTAQPRAYLTAQEAASYLNTSLRFVRRLIAERRIAFHKVGSHVRISTADLDAFLLAGRVEPTPMPGDRRRAVA